MLYNFIRRVELGDYDRKRLYPSFRDIRDGKFQQYTQTTDIDAEKDHIEHTQTIPKPNKKGYESDYARLKRVKALHDSIAGRMWEDAVNLHKPLE